MMAANKLIALAALSMVGCAAPQYGSLRERAAAEGDCDDSPAQRFIGQRATAELGASVLAATGARSLEWIVPGSIVTTAFGPRRVRVTYDRAMIVTEIRCG